MKFFKTYFEVFSCNLLIVKEEETQIKAKNML